MKVRFPAWLLGLWFITQMLWLGMIIHGVFQVTFGVHRNVWFGSPTCLLLWTL